MGIIDVAVLITVFLSIIFALYRGLVRELLGITAWILAGFAGLYSYAFIQPLMHKMIENEAIAGLAGAMIVALVVLIIMTLINAKITAKLRKSALSGLDRILGFGFGVFRAWLLIAVIYIGASMILSEHQLVQADKENYSMVYIQNSAALLEKFIPQNIIKDIKSYEQGKLKDPALKKIGKQIKDNVVEYKDETRRSLDELIEKKLPVDVD